MLGRAQSPKPAQARASELLIEVIGAPSPLCWWGSVRGELPVSALDAPEGSTVSGRGSSATHSTFSRSALVRRTTVENASLVSALTPSTPLILGDISHSPRLRLLASPAAHRHHHLCRAHQPLSRVSRSAPGHLVLVFSSQPAVYSRSPFSFLPHTLGSLWQLPIATARDPADSRSASPSPLDLDQPVQSNPHLQLLKTPTTAIMGKTPLLNQSTQQRHVSKTLGQGSQHLLARSLDLYIEELR